MFELNHSYGHDYLALRNTYQHPISFIGREGREIQHSYSKFMTLELGSEAYEYHPHIVTLRSLAALLNVSHVGTSRRCPGWHMRAETYCYLLKLTVTYWNLLRLTATYWNLLRLTETCWDLLLFTETYCYLLRLTVTSCDLLWLPATYCDFLRLTVTYSLWVTVIPFHLLQMPIIEQEKERRQQRLAGANCNDVWSYRNAPPKEWSQPLPSDLQKEQELFRDYERTSRDKLPAMSRTKTCVLQWHRNTRGR